MNVLVALIAFAGAAVAAVTTGALIGRVRDEREGWLIAWTIVTAGLCLSLGVAAIGALAGFNAVTFRVYQLTGALLPPLWLAIGVIQLLADKVPPRFAAWLLGTAVTVIALVIMAADPIINIAKLDKEPPRYDVHWDLVPKRMLEGLEIIVLLILVVSLILALVRRRGGDDLDADNMHAMVVLTPAGIALIAAIRFALPGVVTVLLLGLVAGAVWYVVARPLAPYEDEDEAVAEPGPEPDPARRVAPAPGRERPVAPPARPSSRSGLGDLVAEYRAGEQGEVDYAARMGAGAFGDQPVFGGQPVVGDPSSFAGPSTGSFAGPLAGADPLGGQAAAPFDAFSGPATGYMKPVGDTPPGGPQEGTRPPGANGTHRGPDRDFGAAHDMGRGMGGGMGDGVPPAAGSVFGSDPAGGGTFGVSRPGADGGRPSPSIYGLLTVFTLMDGSGPAFDRLAEETVEAVKRTEPDTLVFVCHAVKSAPLQRIVYELYRDEVAYAEHQRQPHMERFTGQRVAHVLAANVIELGVNAAKVVPLPTAFRV
jgi:quinol monooxygenase YgiN